MSKIIQICLIFFFIEEYEFRGILFGINIFWKLHFLNHFIFWNDVQFLMTFTQLTARLKNFLRGWLLVLGLKECLVECATMCVKSEVILTYLGKESKCWEAFSLFCNDEELQARFLENLSWHHTETPNNHSVQYFFLYHKDEVWSDNRIVKLDYDYK